MATKLIDLIESVNADDLPTNEFTIEDKDPMVILGKLNEVIAYLQTLQATINASDSKANEALQKAIQAVADATQALSVANGIDAKATQALANAIEAVGTANTALSASNTALSTANTAISTANNAVETAVNALDTAESAETKADTAITTANGAKTTAEGIDAKATTALSNSQTAVSTANTAETKAQEALDQVVAGLGTKVYRDTTLLSNLDIKPIEDDIDDNTTAITALQNGKVDKVTGKQLSTEDFTTAEKNKLAGLNNYDDTQVQADITALQTRATNIETKNTEQDTAIANAQSTANTALTTANGAVKTSDLLNLTYPIGSIFLSVNGGTSPASLLGGTWELLPESYALWTTTTNGTGGSTISAGLPNITGSVTNISAGRSLTPVGSGALSPTYLTDWKKSGVDSAVGAYSINFNANASNSIYGNSTTVQPPAIKVFAWKRIA